MQIKLVSNKEQPEIDSLGWRRRRKKTKQKTFTAFDFFDEFTYTQTHVQTTTPAQVNRFCYFVIIRKDGKNEIKHDAQKKTFSNEFLYLKIRKFPPPFISLSLSHKLMKRAANRSSPH